MGKEIKMLASTSIRKRNNILIDSSHLLVERSRNEQFDTSLPSTSLGNRKCALTERSQNEQLPDTSNLPFDLDELPEGWKISMIKDIVLPVSKIDKMKIKKYNRFLYIDIGSIDNKKNIISSYKDYLWEMLHLRQNN